MIHRAECPAPFVAESCVDEAGVTPHLEEAAAVAARQIELARVLRDRNRAGSGHRPLITFIRRRRDTGHIYSLWRISIEGADEEWLWDVHVALAAHAYRSIRPSRQALRELFAADITGQ